MYQHSSILVDKLDADEKETLINLRALELCKGSMLRGTLRNSAASKFESGFGGKGGVGLVSSALNPKP